MKFRIGFIVVGFLSLSVLVSAQTPSSTIPASSASAPPTNTVNGYGKVNYIPIWKSKITLGNSQLYESGGNVGIDTTNPLWPLDVSGYINTSAAYNIEGSTVLAVPGGVNLQNIALVTKPSTTPQAVPTQPAASKRSIATPQGI